MFELLIVNAPHLTQDRIEFGIFGLVIQLQRIVMRIKQLLNGLHFAVFIPPVDIFPVFRDRSEIVYALRPKNIENGQ
jgi:hypothetical protein